MGKKRTKDVARPKLGKKNVLGFIVLIVLSKSKG